ncbi:hypothetical protein HMPREF9148_00660, partial [Prevotella sp. F0091]
SDKTANFGCLHTFFICIVKINNKYYGTKPDKWKHYFVTWLVVQGRDVQTLIAEYLFINIEDQLKALNKRDENELKNLILQANHV